MIATVTTTLVFGEELGQPAVSAMPMIMKGIPLSTAQQRGC